METKPEKKPRPRRNFEKILTDLKTYCQIKRDVLVSIDATGNDPLWRSQIEAYEDVLKRIG